MFKPLFKPLFGASAPTQPVETPNIVLEIDTSLGASQSFTLPTVVGNGSPFNYYWKHGDGTQSPQITSWNSPDRAHTYAAHGVYEIEIYGELPAWSFDGTGDKLKVTKVKSWKAAALTDYLEKGFRGCSNLTGFGADDDALQLVTRLFSTFKDCALTEWDVRLPPNLTDVFDCFKGNKLTKWSIEIPPSVTRFYGCWSRNQLNQQSVDFILNQIDMKQNELIDLSPNYILSLNAPPSAVGCVSRQNIFDRTGVWIDINGTCA